MRGACSSCINCGACKITEILQRDVLPNKQPSLREKIDEYFMALVELNSFNGCVIIKQNGKEILRKSYNISSDKAKDLRVNMNSQFDIHSISKLFVNLSILKLEKEAKLNRSDYLNKYFADFPNGDKITIQHLMNHQSGLPRELTDSQYRNKDLDLEQLVILIKQEELVFEPGTKVLYSNLGFQLLFYLIAQVSKIHVAQYIKKHIFEALAMEHAGSHYANDNLFYHVQNHTLENGEIIPVSNFEGDNTRNRQFYASADDLMLAINHIKNNDEYWKIISNEEQRIAKWSGGSEGVRSLMLLDKELDYNIVLLSNVDSIPLYKVIEDIPKIIKNEYYELPSKINRKSINLSVNFLKKYEGVYEFIDLNQMVVEFKIQNRKLVVLKEGDEDVILSAASATTFFEAPDSEQWFEFEQTADNEYQIYLIWLGNKWKGNRLT